MSCALWATPLLLLYVTPAVRCEQASGATPKIDRIVVEKAARTMKLMTQGKVSKTYKVALSTEPVGSKIRRGDHRVPEGKYTVNWKIPQSKFHLALHLSYPNAADRERAHRLGVDPGSDVLIRGVERKYAWLGALHRQTDWTDGCIAVTHQENEEIWPPIRVGT